jgi:hypothetical protein
MLALSYHFSYRAIEEMTGIPKSTAQQWAAGSNLPTVPKE